MAKNRLLTLTSDFGSSDPYVGAMKGMILQYAPQAEIVDITHNVPAHNILNGAFVLASAAPFFPTGTLHVAVVDPGVGTSRAILAGRFGGQLFLFPDNGIISFIKQMLPMEALVSVRNTQVLPKRPISSTFHGRDIFAPLAGHILNGMDISELGPVPSSYKLLDLPAPQTGDNTVAGQVVYVDHFRNLITNITEQDIRDKWANIDTLLVSCRGERVGQFAGSYAHVERGTALAVINSMGLVEVAVNAGRACDVFNAGLGAEVCVKEQKFLDV